MTRHKLNRIFYIISSDLTIKVKFKQLCKNNAISIADYVDDGRMQHVFNNRVVIIRKQYKCKIKIHNKKEVIIAGILEKKNIQKKTKKEKIKKLMKIFDTVNPIRTTSLLSLYNLSWIVLIR